MLNIWNGNLKFKIDFYAKFMVISKKHNVFMKNGRNKVSRQSGPMPIEPIDHPITIDGFYEYADSVSVCLGTD